MVIESFVKESTFSARPRNFYDSSRFYVLASDGSAKGTCKGAIYQRGMMDWAVYPRKRPDGYSFPLSLTWWETVVPGWAAGELNF